MGMRSPILTRRNKGSLSEDQPPLKSSNITGNAEGGNVNEARSNDDRVGGMQHSVANIKMNTGDSDVMGLLREVLDTQKQIQGTLNSLKTEQANQKEKLESILVKVDKLETLQDDVVELKNTTETLKRDVNFAFHKIDDLENRLRRNNLLFHGVAEDENETWEVSEEKVVDVLKRKMQHAIEYRAIERAHRVGRKQPGKIRPIVVKFAFFKDRESILRKKKLLQGSKIHVTEDFSQEIRDIRRRLWELTASDRERNVKTFLVFDKIKINGTLYKLNEDWSDLVKVHNQA